jgi:hypothetical protein
VHLLVCNTQFTLLCLCGLTTASAKYKAKNTAVLVQVKVKFTLEQTTKAQTRSIGTALLFLKPQQWMGVGGQHHALATLPQAKIWYPLNRGLGGPQNWSGMVAENLAPTGIQSLDRLASSESLY